MSIFAENLADMSFSQDADKLFDAAVADYHKTDNVDAVMNNPYPAQTIESVLYIKNWIDTVQWHLEDIIRNPEIDPVEALAIKRRIDKSNRFGRENRQLFLGQVFVSRRKTLRCHQHGESCLGHRPPFHPIVEDISHAQGGGASRCLRRP